MNYKKYAILTACAFTLASSINLTPITAFAAVTKIQNTGNDELEKKLNKEIEKKTINKENEENHLSISTHFEEKYRDDQKLSFVITIEEIQASTAVRKYYYNTDLKTGKPLELKDLLGNNYKEIADKTIQEQIAQRMKEDENQIFFGTAEDKEMDIEGFTGIKDDQTFYINKEGNIVITFAQFEIAPGYMGTPEFEIKIK